MAESAGRAVLAVVPARGGSKRVPRKNLQEVGGRSLVHHALAAALDSGSFADVMLSSDDPEILAAGRALGGVLCEAREAEHAGDSATIFGYLRALAARDDLAARYDAIALLLPTAPFRTAAHVRAAVALLDAQVDAVVSVTGYEFPPQFAVAVAGDDPVMTPAWPDSPLLTGHTRSQDQVPLYHPNGALYCAWWAAYRRLGGFFGGRVRAYVMSRAESFDIDTPEDLEEARRQWARRPTPGVER